jgi:hypothetical protein
MMRVAIFMTPSPRMNPYANNPLVNEEDSPKLDREMGHNGYQILTDASTMSGVSSQPFLDLHHQLRTPPMVRASVNEGTLYMPGWVEIR